MNANMRVQPLQTAVRRTFSTTAMALLALSLLGRPAGAQESAEGWQPPPPMPDDFDWVQLTSLEWLKGEIISLYRDELMFDSDKLEIQSLDWEDIKAIRSGRPMEVSLENGIIAVGKIILDETTLRVEGDEDKQYARSAIVSITTKAPKEIHNWDMKVSVGGNYRRGNTQQVETTGKADFIRRTARRRVALSYLTTFNETDKQTAADSQRGSVVWNHYIRPRLYVTAASGEWFRDPFQNIASRWTIGGGLGYELIDSAKTSLNFSVGAAYQRTQFDDVAEDRPAASSTPALAGNTSYEYELTGWTDFAFDYQFFVVNEESGIYTHHLVTGIEIDITRLIDFDVTLIWDRIQAPQQASDGTFPNRDDFRLVLSLGFEF
jgi:putative salt-induced outer membrane protein YdiY